MNVPTFRLDGRVALITGGAQGIGRSIAFGFAASGAVVAVADRNADKLRTVCDELNAMGCHGSPLMMDVGDPLQIEGCVDSVLARFGRIDILVNNAAIRVHKEVLDHTLEDWERVFRVNCTGPFLLCQACARSMRETNGGSIINISSQMAIVTSPDRVAYCASKAALNQMTRVMAVDLARFNIRVNAIGPGPVETPFTTLASATDSMPVDAKMVPLGRIANADEIVGAAIYLASDASTFVTGAFLVVDGGQSVMWR